MDGIEQKLMYLPVDARNLRTIKVDLLDLNTKLNVKFESEIAEKLYIINI